MDMIEQAALMRRAKQEKRKKDHTPYKKNDANKEIRRLMKLNRVSQSDVAKDAGVVVYTINKWLKTEQPDNMQYALRETIRKIATEKWGEFKEC